VEPNTQTPVWGDVLVTFTGQDAWATFNPGFVIGFGANPPIWSLTIEISFYILLPFIASAYCRRPLLGLAIAAGLSIAWRLGFANVADLAGLLGIDVSAARAAELRLASYNQLPSWAFAFGAGMTAAWAYVSLPRRFGPETVRGAARPALLAAVAAIAICAYFSSRYSSGTVPVVAALKAQRDVLLFLAYVSAIASAMLALSLSGWRSPFAAPFARRLGDISYGVFLIQIPVIGALIVFTGLDPNGSVGALALFAAIVVAICIAYGYLSARFVEQPIRRWARRYDRRAKEPSPAPA
jgi:peptidoglycan/LPS O-acetylase OafA/YrhL